MKHIIILSLITLVSFAISCADDDPCIDIHCNQFDGSLGITNTCANGACTCEIEDFGVAVVQVKCTNCDLGNRLNLTLLIDNITVQNHELSHDSWQFLYLSKYDPGVYNYEINSNGSIILDSGNIEVKRCETFELNAIVEN